MRIFYALLLSCIATACISTEETFISSTNPNIEYWGRVDAFSGENVEIYWSGTSIKINFEGESIEALLSDKIGDNYYNVILDNDSIFTIKPTLIKQYYQLGSHLSNGKHTVELFKRTEWDKGTTTCYGFRLGKNSKLLPKSPPKKRKIEFYGNSITAGYAVEDTSGVDCPDSTLTNNYKSYAALTARNYDAQYQCICKSGIGIIVSWFPLIMPEIYDRLDPLNKTSHWDFSTYSPDLVVVNLCQNDSWIVKLPQHAEFKARFGEKVPSEKDLIQAYQQFVANLRKHYPKASIICMLGNMDATKLGSPWPNYIMQAATKLNDDKIYTHFAPYKNTPGHPSVSEQEQLAQSLIQFIDENISW